MSYCDQADSRTCPWRRRAFRTARPAAVAIRWRKPCLLDLLRVLGWNVRFISASFRRSGRRRVLVLPPWRRSGEAGAIDPPRRTLHLAWKARVHQTAGTGRGYLAHDSPADQAAAPRQAVHRGCTMRLTPCELAPPSTPVDAGVENFLTGGFRAGDKKYSNCGMTVRTPCAHRCPRLPGVPGSPLYDR